MSFFDQIKNLTKDNKNSKNRIIEYFLSSLKNSIVKKAFLGQNSYRDHLYEEDFHNLLSFEEIKKVIKECNDLEGFDIKFRDGDEYNQDLIILDIYW